MRSSSKAFLFVAVFALTGAAAILSIRALEYVRDRQERTYSLEAQVLRQELDLKRASRAINELQTEAAARSNRADAAEAAFDEERKTTEPLRRQIEKLNARQVGLDAGAEKHKQEIRRLKDIIERNETKISELENKLQDARHDRDEQDRSK